MFTVSKNIGNRRCWTYRQLWPVKCGYCETNRVLPQQWYETLTTDSPSSPITMFSFTLWRIFSRYIAVLLLLIPSTCSFQAHEKQDNIWMHFPLLMILVFWVFWTLSQISVSMLMFIGMDSLWLPCFSFFF